MISAYYTINDIPIRDKKKYKALIVTQTVPNSVSNSEWSCTIEACIGYKNVLAPNENE